MSDWNGLTSSIVKTKDYFLEQLDSAELGKLVDLWEKRTWRSPVKGKLTQ